MRLAATPEAPADNFDHLLGPPQMRPGELHERYPHAVSSAFLHAACARGVPASLAVSLVCERQLAIRELLGMTAAAPGDLDLAARSQTASALSELASDYARMLVAAISGPIVTEPTHGPAVIPARLENRLRATDIVVELDARDIEIALWWELAAIVSGATMTEWALRQALRASVYSAPNERHGSAAASTAR